MQSFTCTALLGIPLGGFELRAPGCHGLWPIFPHRYARRPVSHIKVPQPRPDKSGRFRLFRFRSPLLTESHSFSFPGVTEMFHFAPFRLAGL